MSKKILVLMGSPRRNGNTALMVEAFEKGAAEAGNEVSVFYTAEKKLDGCIHCNTCWSKGRACSCEDDFKEVSEMLESYDALVLAAPLYWSQFPSYIKAAIDKLYAYVVPMCQRKPTIKKLALITCGDMEDESAFDEILPWYKGLAAYMQWEDGGYVAIPRLMNAGDVKETEGLEKAYALGKSI